MKRKAPMSEREAARIGPRLLKDPSSVEFAWQTLALLKTMYQSKENSLDRWERILAEADRHRIYERIPREKPYGSLDAMLRAEIGETAATAMQKIRLRDKAGRPPETERNGRQSTNIGRANAYRLARLERDRPDILDAMKAGKFKSVRQAAIAAGIVKLPTALEKAKRAVAPLNAQEWQALLHWKENQL